VGHRPRVLDVIGGRTRGRCPQRPPRQILQRSAEQAFDDVIGGPTRGRCRQRPPRQILQQSAEHAFDDVIGGPTNKRPHTHTKDTRRSVPDLVTLPVKQQWMKNDLFNLAKRLKSIADIGLLYSHDAYNRERYSELAEISIELLHELTGLDPGKLRGQYIETKEYPTAKVDIRTLILRDNKVLLVKEMADQKWSLPGGWADIGYSAAESVIKECREETGLDVRPLKLLAVFDNKMHAHPPQPFYAYKMVFLCEALSHEINPGFDVLGAGYFALDELPTLSEERILEEQVRLLYQIATTPGAETYFE
jgi:ADP-ribose pyrophosphatase YjhB (NUDIX family)